MTEEQLKALSAAGFDEVATSIRHMRMELVSVERSANFAVRQVQHLKTLLDAAQKENARLKQKLDAR